METTGLLIGGRWRPAEAGDTIAVHAPSNGREISRIARGTRADVDRAVLAARRAFDGVWGNMPAVERGRRLSRLARLIEDNLEDLALLEAADTGKPISQARTDVTVCARYFEFYGGAADKLHGEVIPYLEGYQVMILREPRGVTGHIIPWNYPVSMFGRTIGPALAAGNAVVLKPAEEACLGVIRVAALAAEAGIPEGVVNVVTGYGEEAGAALAGHAEIDLVSFTGSPEVGTLVQVAAARNHVPCILELGGKSPQIVFEDADQEKAIEAVVRAIVQNAGQTCSAGSRVLVQRSVYEQFMRALAGRFARLRVGPHDADLDCGAVISRTQQQRVESYLASGRDSGLEVVATGVLDDRADPGGYFVRPTLLGLVPEGHALAQEEVFGPVLAAIPFDDEADALRIANGTDFGLVAGVWTENGGRQLRVAKRLRVGQVFVNSYGAGGGVELPFGGVKKSGHGREKGLEALREFTVAKTVVLNHG